MTKLINLINERPVVVVGVIIALHSLSLGLSYVFQLPPIRETVLYAEIGTLMPQVVFGIVLCFAAISGLLAWLTDKSKNIKMASSLQAFIFLFVFFVYLISGAPFLAFAHGLAWSLLAGYMGYVYKHRVYTRY